MKIHTAIPVIVLGTLLAVGPAVAQQGPPPAAVSLGQVARESIQSRISGVATVEPWKRSVLSVEIGGLVESYPLREGDRVVAGKTVVCELSRTSLLIDLAEAKALLARARAEADTSVATSRASMEEQQALYDQAQREFERAKDLRKNQVITQSDLDRAEADATAAKHRLDRARESYQLASEGVDPAQQALVAEVRRAEAQLARVQDQIAKTTITSPLDGRVVRRFVEVGSWVNPGSSVIEVMSLDPVLVRIAVNEKDISKVEKGNGAVVTVDSLPDKEFQGEVRFLVPEADSRSRSFPVLIEVPNPEEALMPGMFARVGILCGQAHEAFTVPKNAIVNTPQGAAVVVLGPKKVVAMGDRKMPLPTAQYVPVKKGISAGDRIEVRGEGLAPGMPVVTVGNESLMPGQPLIPSGGAPGGGAPGGASGGGEKR